MNKSKEQLGEEYGIGAFQQEFELYHDKLNVDSLAEAITDALNGSQIDFFIDTLQEHFEAKKCQYCDGFGEVESPYDPVTDERHWGDCPKCKGTGKKQ